MAIYYVGDNGPDGVVMGLTSASKIGFYNTTPIVQATVALATGTATTTTNETKINAVITALSNLGLLVTA